MRRRLSYNDTYVYHGIIGMPLKVVNHLNAKDNVYAIQLQINLWRLLRVIETIQHSTVIRITHDRQDMPCYFLNYFVH